MRPSLISSSLLLLTSFASTSTALEALTNSPCAVQCGNVLGSTSGNDIVCPDSSYTTTLAGQTFSSCITCQLSSKYQDPVTKQTDLQWALYNLRYAMSWCLFGYPNNTAVGDTPCLTSFACGPLQSSIELDSLAPGGAEYSYCALMLESVSVSKCSGCLAQQSNEYYLANFLTALNAACVQQPTPGNTISIQGSLFSTTQVNATSPTPSAAAFVPSHGLSLGAKIGIAVGGILLALSIAGFCIVWSGKRRRRAILQKVQQQSGYQDWMKAQHHSPEDGLRGAQFPQPTPTMIQSPFRQFFDSPDSQAPLRPAQWPSPRIGENESPVSAIGEKAYFSPYSSQYTSPVSATDPIMIGREWPMQLGRSGSEGGRSSARGPHTDGRVQSRSRSREKKGIVGGQFEMQNVAPVLQHPGHGRGGPLGLPEEDAKRGAAM